MNNKISKVMPFIIGATVMIASCSKKSSNPSPMALNPSTAPVVSVDRFSSSAGTLQVRTATNGLPAANAAVNFDKAPFITQGYTPSGQVTLYYNFDVQSTTPAPIWVLYKSGDTTPVTGQLNIINVLPGSAGYNDFWLVYKVTVPSNYVANTVTSYSEIVSNNYPVAATTTIVNCPVVPAGSTASKRFNSTESTGLIQGWYKDSIVNYFTFAEKALLTTTAGGLVPLSPIYVTFNINPGQTNGGPSSGFKTDGTGVQTHNVIATVPSDAAYSPLWMVNIYNNDAFDSVSNLSTATSVQILVPGAANVNCPVVNIQ